MSLQLLASLAMEPLYHWLLLVLVLLVLAIFQRHGMVKVGVLLSLYMGVVLLSPIPSWLLQYLEHSYIDSVHSGQVKSMGAKPAVVVLSGGIVNFDSSRQQFLWGSSADRYLEAVRKFGNPQSDGQLETVFIFSGVSPNLHSKKHFLSEAESMRAYSGMTGIEESNIIVEGRSTSTWENARYTSEVLRDLGIDDFYLVTSGYHMNRSMMAFRYFGAEPTPVAVDFQFERGLRQKAFANLTIYRMAIHELVGIVYYKFKIFFASGDEAAKNKKS